MAKDDFVVLFLGTGGPPSGDELSHEVFGRRVLQLKRANFDV